MNQESPAFMRGECQSRGRGGINIKIVRKMLGSEIEIELTDMEMYDAYCEKQHMYDVADIEDVVSWYDSDKEFEEVYEMSKRKFGEYIDEMASLSRKYQDKYDMNWRDARDEAIEVVLASHMMVG